MLTELKPVQWTLANLPNLIPKGAAQLALAAGAAVTKQVIDIFLAGDVQNAPYPAIDFAEKASTLVQQNAPQATWDAAVHVAAHPKHHLSSLAHSGAFAPKHIATPTQLTHAEFITPTPLLLLLAAIMIIVAASGARFSTERISQMSYNRPGPHRIPGITAGNSFGQRANAPAGSSFRMRGTGGSGGGSGGGRRPQAPSPEPDHDPNFPRWPDCKRQPWRRHPGGAPPPPPPPPPPSTTPAARRNKNPGRAPAFVDSFLVILAVVGSFLSFLPHAITFIKGMRYSRPKSDVVQPSAGVAVRNSTAADVKPQSGPQCTNTIPLTIAIAPTPTVQAPARVTTMYSRYTAMLTVVPPPPIIDIDDPDWEPVQIALNASNVEEHPLKFTLLSPPPSTSYPVLLLLFACDFVLFFVCTVCISLSPRFLFARYLQRTPWADVWRNAQLGAQLLMNDDVAIEETCNHCNDVWKKMFQPITSITEVSDILPSLEAGPSIELVSVNSEEQEAGPSTLLPSPKPRQKKKSFLEFPRKLKTRDVSFPAPAVCIEQSVEPSADQDILPAIPSHSLEVEQTIESSSTENIECDEQTVTPVSISEPERPIRSLTPTSAVEVTTAQEEQVDEPAEPIQSVKDKDADNINQPSTPTGPIPEPQQAPYDYTAAANDAAQIAGPSVPRRRMLQGPIRLPKTPSSLRRPTKTIPSVSAPLPEIEHAIQSPAVDEPEAVLSPQAEQAHFVANPAPEEEGAKVQCDIFPNTMPQSDLPHSELVQPITSWEMFSVMYYALETKYTGPADPAHSVPSPAPENEGAIMQSDHLVSELAQTISIPVSELDIATAPTSHDVGIQQPFFLPQAEPTCFVPNPAPEKGEATAQWEHLASEHAQAISIPSELDVAMAPMGHDVGVQQPFFLPQTEAAFFVPNPAPEKGKAKAQWDQPHSKPAYTSELDTALGPMDHDAATQNLFCLPQVGVSFGALHPQPALRVPSPVRETEEVMVQWDQTYLEFAQPVSSPVSRLEATMEQVDYDMEPTTSIESFETEEQDQDLHMESSLPEITQEMALMAVLAPMAQMMVPVSEDTLSFEGCVAPEEARDTQMECAAPEPTEETMPQMTSQSFDTTQPSIEGVVAEQGAQDQQTEFAAPEPTEETILQMMSLSFNTTQPYIEGFVAARDPDQQTEFAAPEPMLDRPVRPLPKRLRVAKVTVSESSRSNDLPVASELPAVHTAPGPVFGALDILAMVAAESRLQELHAQTSIEVPEVEPRIVKALPKGRNLQPRAPDPNIFNFLCMNGPPLEKAVEPQGGFLFESALLAHSSEPEQGETMAQAVVEGRVATDVVAPETPVNEDTEDISREDKAAAAAAAAADSDDDDMEEVHIPEYLATYLPSQSEGQGEDDAVDYDYSSTESEADDDNNKGNIYSEGPPEWLSAHSSTRAAARPVARVSSFSSLANALGS